MDVFRRNQRELAPHIIQRVGDIKSKAQELYDLLDQPVNADGEPNDTDPRCIATAKTNLEQSVLWAIKGLTA